MSEYAQRQADWIKQNNVAATLLSFEQSVHSVEQAVTISGYAIEHISKSIVLQDYNNKIIIAMVPSCYRVSTERVRKALSLEQRPVTANAELIEQQLQQKIGGNSPLNAGNAEVLIDPTLLDIEWILTGGGDDKHLIKIATQELCRVVEHRVVRVRK